MAQTPEEFVERLTALSRESGQPFGRLRLLYDEENSHHDAARKYRGYWALSDAFKCFYLETVELTNTHIRPLITQPLSEHYPLLVSRLVHTYRALCGAEHMAEYGYPLQAFTILRNTFDSLVLTSAALQGLTDFYNIEGVIPGQPLDELKARKLRKDTEYAVRRKMTGAQSGLSKAALDDFAIVDKVFDHEVHGARMSLAFAAPWLRGQAGLSIVPKFDERQMSIFFNRSNEAQWLLHRLLPLMQPANILLPKHWAEKWQTLDAAFEYLINELTAQLGKTIGASTVEFVKAKFPFNERSVFPL